MSVSVVTASLPERSAMLAEAMASVRGQSLAPDEHLIGVDYAYAGPSAVRNRLAAAARGDWIAVLDDDDLLYPTHLARLVSADADLVYSYCEVEGRSGWTPNSPFDAERLRHENYIPATVLIRHRLLDALGGWRDRESVPNGWEDWDLYRRALDAGATFACVPEITWCYRYHGGNTGR